MYRRVGDVIAVRSLLDETGRRPSDVELEDGSHAPFGSDEHITDLERCISHMTRMRNRYGRGTAARDRHARSLSGLKNELSRARRYAAVNEARERPGIGRLDRETALDAAEWVVTALGFHFVDPSRVGPDTQWMPDVGIPVGSLRRGKADVGDIDIVITSGLGVSEVGEFVGTSDVSGSKKRIDFTYDHEGTPVRINIWTCPDPQGFGAMLLATTGPQVYNIRLRASAKKRGMKLSEKGLFDASGRLLAGETESSIQETLGVRLRKPEER